MIFEKIVNRICNELYHDAIPVFRKDWLDTRSHDIDAEVNRQISAEEKSRKEEGFWNTSLSYYEERQIRKKVKSEYVDKFNKEVLPHLEKLWQQKVKDADFVRHLEDFFKRHPWLQTLADQEGDSALPTLYINDVIRQTLMHNERAFSGERKFRLTYDGFASSPTSFKIVWPEVNRRKLIHRFHGYPLELIDQSNFSVFTQLPSIDKSWNNLNQYRLSRLDIYRLLTNHFAIHIDNDGGQQYFAKVLPVELDEIAELDTFTKQHCHSWLINIGSVGNPYWIFIDKHYGRTSLYIPTELTVDDTFVRKFNQIKAVFPIDDIVPVDNDCETKYTHIPENLVWQYQLFARVLPYCLKRDRSLAFNHYRQGISLYHLVSYVWESLIESYDFNTFSLLLRKAQAARRFQYAQPLGKLPWHRLLNQIVMPDELNLTVYEPLRAKRILKSIDKQKIQVLPSDVSEHTLMLKAVVEGNHFIRACFMACFQPVSQMSLILTANSKKDMPDVPMYIFEKAVERLNCVNFSISGPDESINPGHFPPLVRLSNGAACNRLLQTTYSVPLADLKVADRWADAGRLILSLFQRYGDKFDPKSIQTYLQKEKAWRQDWFNPDHAPKSESFAWQLAQFAQMGRLGLDSFFEHLRVSHLKHWHPIHQTPQLNIPVLFDLNGDHLLSAAQYTEHLNEQLSHFVNDERCVPKFSQIHLILPEPSTRAAREEMAKLLKTVSDCKYSHSKETDAFYLYEFKHLSEQEQDDWLKVIESLAEQDDQPLIAMIRIPELDEQVSDDPQDNQLKARYRALQNKILDNQRLHHQKQLAENTTVFYQGALGTLDPMVDIRNLKHRIKQPFPGKDEAILLAATTPGIQQELQQNVEARHEVVQQLEERRVTFEEELPEIKRYPLDLSRLISRDNIQKKLKATGEGVNWEQHFNQWVGSDIDASYLINYIEPEALEKIRQYQPYFQMGVELNHLPFGFYLSHHPLDQTAYILCYDENRSKEHRHEWELKTKEARNPFIPHLDSKARPVNFDGDFRQFNLIGKDEGSQVSLWYHLATLDLPPEQKDRQVDCLRKITKTHVNKHRPDIPVIMSRYEVSGKSERPWNIDQIREHIAGWAQTVIGYGKGNAFIRLMIGSMDAAQLKAYGQLCYHFDSQKDGVGSKHLLRVAFTLYQTFGEANFKIWQKAIFANSENAAELLDKSNLDAIGLSLITLKDKSPAYTSIWFRLIEAQFNQTGLVRYDRLWYAYQALISYIDNKQLTIDDEIVARLLSGHDQFQPVVWMDRLYHCLKMTEGQLYESNAQQAILDNLDNIDWHHNGLFYAMTHNQMPYWSEDMALQCFNHADPRHGYEPHWDKPIMKKSLAVQFGRYLAAKLRINYKQYQHYVETIKPVLEGEDISYSVARLLLVHLTHGIDNVVDWTNKDTSAILKELCNDGLHDVVAWLNQQFSLDDKHRGDRYQVTLIHLPLICRVLKRYGLENLDASDFNERMAILNALGKTCQYLHSQSMPDMSTMVLQLETMTDQALKVPGFMAAMRQTPWLLFNKAEPWQGWRLSKDKNTLACQQRLLQQLESIAYSTSTWFPGRNDINHALDQLESADLLDDTRREIIAGWVSQGCDIAVQDATFRELKNKEKENLISQFSEQLLPQHAKENTALFSMLVPSLAIEANLINPEQVFTDLVAQFMRIDNKPHFNDLGIVLGGLVSHVQKHRPANMSLQQLTELLAGLTGSNHDELTHFPTEMLIEILAQSGKKLTNQQLNGLSAKIAPALKKNMTLLVHAEIPNRIKPILLRMLPKGLSNEQFEWIINVFSAYGIDDIDVSYQIEVANALLLIASAPASIRDDLITAVTGLPDDMDNKELLLKSRHQLLKAVNKAGSFAQLQVLKPLLLGNTQEYPEIEIIAIHTLPPHAANADELKQVLQRLNQSDLKKLAQYCTHPPTPSAGYLIRNIPAYSVDKLIHHFETVEQAKGLRHYSVTEPDNQALKRVLAGIQEKGKGYISDAKQKEVMGLLYYVNAYAQEQDLANMPSAQLKLSLRQTAQWLQATQTESTQITYRLQLLSMLREVLLRQTGKWANHTQMLDLIYASLHNDESLFHQVKTGQGKSIIAIMRVAFHALNGKVVDVFTAKESLSSRDHEEFGHILDAIGIEHTHILPDSDENAYKVGDDVFGAVNYMTPGSFSLYQSGHCWDEHSRRYINFRSKERVAFFDEGDHVLLDEQTMFNFSYGGDSGKLYNYDAWVYRATWRYFQTIKDKLPVNEKGIPYISRKQHLAGLCEYLQQQGDFAPVQSNFIKTYLAPVVDETVVDKKEAIAERDKILANLLSAAYTAGNLQENRDYCIQSGMTALSDGMTIEGRAAKVVINNQVQGGATYSERVHQFLHVRLNEQALKNGQQPNFFIAPDSAIVLSQNVPALIKNYYSQIEGCSGTMGDTGDLAVYRQRFGIEHVVKLPTHEVSQTKYVGMVFCEGEDSHQQVIVDYLKEYRDQPVLLVSEDDVAVKSMSSRLRGLLPAPMAKKLICDTNDSGHSEKDILPHAGKPGVIVNSSRMARGTDIKPETDKGLLVIRSNPDIPRFAKQSGGRQGRNGAKGVLVDIIDYAKVQRQFDQFAKSPYADRLGQLMERERQHLRKKLEKHQRNKSDKWDWIYTKEGNLEKYLKTRVVQYLNREVKIQREQNIRGKEAVVSDCTSHVIKQLMLHIGEDQAVMRHIRKDWLHCRELMESAWQQRMTGAVEENEAVFNQFYHKAKLAWQAFANKYPDYLDNNLLDDQESILRSVKSMQKTAWNEGEDAIAVPDPTQKPDMTQVIHFYQDWLKRVGPTVLADLPAELQPLFYGKSNQGLNDLDAFYQILVSASQHLPDHESHALTNNTQALFNQLAALPLPAVTYIPLNNMIQLVKTFGLARTKADFDEKLNCLDQLFKHACAEPVDDINAHHMVTLGETSQFLMRLACRGYIGKDSDDYRRFTTPQSVKHIADILWHQLWPSLTPNHFACFDRLINQDESVARLLTTHLSARHWQTLLEQLGCYDNALSEDRDYLDSVVEYLKNNQALLNSSHPEVLTALLDIFFYYPHRRIDATQFPKPDCLTHASVEDNIRLIHFIAEQYMISEHETEQLVKIINDAYSEDEVGAKTMSEKVIAQITSLPANIPFSMIRARVEHIADNHNLRGFPQAIEALTNAGKALNAFTNGKGITTPENALPSEGVNEALLKRAQAVLESKDTDNHLHDATLIFKELSQSKYNYLDANTCLLAVEQYDRSYQNVLALLLRAQTVMEGDAYEKFHQVCFQEDDKLTLDTLSRIVDIFADHKKRFATDVYDRQTQQDVILQQCLKRKGIDVVNKKFKALKQYNVNLENPHIWQQWQSAGERSDVFGEQLRFIVATDGLDLQIKERVQRLLNNGYDKALLERFVDLANQNTAIPVEQLNHILTQWEEKNITDESHLARVFEAQKLANILETESSENAGIRQSQGLPTFSSVFDNFNSNSQGAGRLSLMHSISHSLIKFSQALQEKCWNFYQTLVSRVGDVKSQMDQLPENQRSKGLSTILRSLKGMTMELAFVAKPEPALQETAQKDVNYYSQLVTAFEKQYTGSWLKYFTINRTRWQQAQTMFGQLKERTDPTKEAPNRTDFYLSMLKVIEQTQIDILDKDKERNIANQKGYSRLLDISQQLGLQIGKDIIADRNLDHQTKKQVYDWLKNQEHQVVYQLWTRIPSNYDIVGKIQPYGQNPQNAGPAEIATCKEAIKGLQPDELPKDVRYLLPILKGHFEITDEMYDKAIQDRKLSN